MKKIIEYYCELPQSVRPSMWRIWHNLINLFDAQFKEVFLNYGYAGDAGEFGHLVLKKEDEPHRYGIQLYDHVVDGDAIRGRSVLEVGCGRGGGASFLTRYYQPKEYIGLDISERTTAFCNRFHHVPGLQFVRGSAMRLPFDAGRFDAVVNVESARCYSDMGLFFREVNRVLTHQGAFYFADMIKNKDVETVEALLLQSGFEIIQHKDIRENVVQALHLDAASRKKVIDERVPGWLRAAFYEFAGVEGSNRFLAFANNEMQYRSYVLRKTT